MSMARLDSSGDTLFLDESFISCDSLGGRGTICTPPSSGMGSTHSLPSGIRHSSAENSTHRAGHCANDTHIYEDIESSGPPKIAPISGVLSKGKVVIRPIAFKPVVPSNNRYTSMPTVNLATPVIGGHASAAASLTRLPVRVGSSLGGGSLGNGSVLSGSNGGGEGSGGGVINGGPLNSTGSPYHHHLPESDLKSSTLTLSHYGVSQSSYLLDVDARSATYSTDSCIKLSETPASYFSSSNIGRGSVLHLDDFTQTPSPSDSGVAELEAMLKEKDSEINYLRETMEQNEQVIFKVYEEKELSWQRELKRLKAQYDGKLKSCHQRALKMEQMLMMQTYQLQQDKRKLRQECEDVKRERETTEHQAEELRQELEVVRSQLEETEWTMCQKSGEISLLKSQLKDSQGDQTTRAAEMLQVKAQLREAKAESECKDQEVLVLNEQVSSLNQELVAMRRYQQNASAADARLKESLAKKERQDAIAAELKSQVERLQAEVGQGRQQLVAQRDAFEEERAQWLEEKEKVIMYQKQLQLNYVQMYRRNRTLESEVEQLTLELEGRDLKIINGESHC